MTTLHHVYAIKNLLNHGPASDDFNYSDRLIAHFLQVARAKLIEQKADKYNFIAEQSYQDLCVDLELSNYHGCCGAAELDCKIMKSTLEIPKFLNSRWGNFLKVTDLEGTVIPELNLTQSKLSKYGLAPSTTGWFLSNNHIYIVNNKMLTKILLNALFDDPDSVHKKNCPDQPDGSTCVSFLNTEFPIDSDLVSPMYELVIKFLMLTSANDLENNARDTQKVQVVQ